MTWQIFSILVVRLLPLVLSIALMYFLVPYIRNKVGIMKHKRLVNSLKAGDRVCLSNGSIVTIKNISGEEALVTKQDNTTELFYKYALAKKLNNTK